MDSTGTLASAWAMAMTSACPSMLGARKEAGREPLLFLPLPRIKAIDGVAVGQGIGEPLENDDARSIAEHGSGGVGVEWTAMAVLCKDASLLIEEAALLRNRNIDAAGESHIALMIEKRAAGVVDGQQGCGAGGIEADGGAAEIEKIGSAQCDVVLLVAVLDGELAGQGQQIRVSEEVGCVVVIVAAAGKDADASPGIVRDRIRRFRGHAARVQERRAAAGP